MIHRLILMTSVITMSLLSLLAQGMPLNDYGVPTNSVVATPNVPSAGFYDGKLQDRLSLLLLRARYDYKRHANCV